MSVGRQINNVILWDSKREGKRICLTHKGGDVEPGEVIGDPGLPLLNLGVHVSRSDEAPQDEAPEEEDGETG
jgi:hypothetical protein